MEQHGMIFPNSKPAVCRNPHWTTRIHICQYFWHFKPIVEAPVRHCWRAYVYFLHNSQSHLNHFWNIPTIYDYDTYEYVSTFLSFQAIERKLTAEFLWIFFAFKWLLSDVAGAAAGCWVPQNENIGSDLSNPVDLSLSWLLECVDSDWLWGSEWAYNVFMMGTIWRVHDLGFLSIAEVVEFGQVGAWSFGSLEWSPENEPLGCKTQVARSSPLRTDKICEFSEQMNGTTGDVLGLRCLFLWEAYDIYDLESTNAKSDITWHPHGRLQQENPSKCKPFQSRHTQWPTVTSQYFSSKTLTPRRWPNNNGLLKSNLRALSKFELPPSGLLHADAARLARQVYAWIGSQDWASSE